MSRPKLNKLLKVVAVIMICCGLAILVTGYNIPTWLEYLVILGPLPFVIHGFKGRFKESRYQLICSMILLAMFLVPLFTYNINFSERAISTIEGIGMLAIGICIGYKTRNRGTTVNRKMKKGGLHV